VDLVFGLFLNGKPTFTTTKVFGFDTMVFYNVNFDKTFDTRHTAIVEVEEATLTSVNLRNKRIYISGYVNHLELASERESTRKNLSTAASPSIVSGYNVLVSK